VLVDTSAFFALTNRRDTNHQTALAIRDRLIGERWHLFTTNYVLVETHALLLARLGRGVALRVLEEVEQSTATIVRADPGDEVRGRAIPRQYDDHAFTLADAISFAVMERLGISFAFTFDRHFAQYGSTVVAPGQS
jgi:hypothetical protein